MAGGSSKTLFTNPFGNDHDNDNRPSSAGSAMQKQTPGVNSTGAYLLAGVPFVLNHTVTSGQVDKVSFPRVTRSITIINKDADSHDLHIAFSQRTHAFDHHRVALANERDAITLNVRCNEIFLKAVGGDCTYEIVAELTPILSTDFPSLSGADNAGLSTNVDGTNWEVTANVNLS